MTYTDEVVAFDGYQYEQRLTEMDSILACIEINLILLHSPWE